MKTFICDICGDAYLGIEKPKNCPLCGAREAFMKDGSDVDPVMFNVGEISVQSKKNLLETLSLEKKATALYTCMSGKTDNYEVKSMFKRLAAVEGEHISIVCKILKIENPKLPIEDCSERDIENFKQTLELEKTATNLYFKFAKEATEKKVKIMFTGLAQAEEDHTELIKNYL